MLTLISALLIEWRVNFSDVNYHYFSPKSVTREKASFVGIEIFRYHGHCEERSKWPNFFA